MPPIPAVCGSCGTVFPSPISVGPTGGNATFKNVRVSGCPVCGGDGTILNGTYTALGDVVAYLASAPDELRAAVAVLELVASGEKTAEDAARQLREVAPGAATLWDFIGTPKGSTLSFLLMALLAALAIVVPALDDGVSQQDLERAVERGVERGLAGAARPRQDRDVQTNRGRKQHGQKGEAARGDRAKKDQRAKRRQTKASRKRNRKP